MVDVQISRKAVGLLSGERGYDVTRACELIGISRSLFGSRSRSAGPAALLAQIQALLRREVRPGNWKKACRLLREVDLIMWRRDRRRKAPCERQPPPTPNPPNQSWLIDFVADGRADGRRLRCLAIVNDCTRECLVLEVDTSLTGQRVVAVLKRLAGPRGLPGSITVDHSSEFESQVLDT